MKIESIGMTDEELESLVNPKTLNAGSCAWKYWTSEIYSFGRLFREWGYYPKLFPLYIYSDHGVDTAANFSSHDCNNDANVYVTFSEDKANSKPAEFSKQLIRITHLWISYRRKKNYKQAETAKGTLVFFSHSVPGIEIIGHDTEEFFDELKQLPEKYQPIILCLHMHDINNGYHKKLRKHGMPIVTAGNTQSINFVDNFYNMISNVKYACSNDTGSHLYYCVDMGIPYFFIGDRPKAINVSHPEEPLGERAEAFDDVHAKNLGIEKQLFSTQVDSVTDEQRAFVERILGVANPVSRLYLSWILWREFFRHWRDWPEFAVHMPRYVISYILKKIRLYNFAVDIWRKIKKIQSTDV